MRASRRVAPQHDEFHFSFNTFVMLRSELARVSKHARRRNPNRKPPAPYASPGANLSAIAANARAAALSTPAAANGRPSSQAWRSAMSMGISPRNGTSRSRAV